MTVWVWDKWIITKHFKWKMLDLAMCNLSHFDIEIFFIFFIALFFKLLLKYEEFVILMIASERSHLYLSETILTNVKYLIFKILTIWLLWKIILLRKHWIYAILDSYNWKTLYSLVVYFIVCKVEWFGKLQYLQYKNLLD